MPRLRSRLRAAFVCMSAAPIIGRIDPPGACPARRARNGNGQGRDRRRYGIHRGRTAAAAGAATRRVELERDHLAGRGRHGGGRDVPRPARVGSTSPFPTPKDARPEVVRRGVLRHPNGVAMQQARELLDAGVQGHRSGGRFPHHRHRRTWEKWYGMEHAVRIWSPRPCTACPKSRAQVRGAACSPTPAVIPRRSNWASCRCSRRA
jgi:hypothetical protein